MRDALFIDGGWHPSSSGRHLPVIDPATEEEFHRVPAGNASDIARAVDAAERAFAGSWRRTAGAERATLLRNIGRNIEERKDALAELETRDNGKPLPEALWD
ncbi:aldehyde dehydrogenase family protein, partial [Rhizobiaceae sp. 2RAB30]